MDIRLKTRITFLRNGRPMTHSFGRLVPLFEAMDCFRRGILEPAGSRVPDPQPVAITDITVHHPIVDADTAKAIARRVEPWYQIAA